MRLSLVTVKRRPARDGGEEEVSRRETLLDGETLRVGRGPDCDVTIPDVDVDHHHATLEAQDGRLTLLSVSEGKLQYGNKRKRRAILEPGKPVTLGGHTLTLESPPEHADYRLALEAIPAPATAPPERTTLASVLPSRRRLAWVLAVPVLALTLVWPVWEALTPPLPDTSPDRVVALTAEQSPASHPVLAAWTSGPMSVAHELIGEDCGACHQQAFEMTPDRSCLACHAETARHAPVPGFPVAGLDDIRCAACHKEHEGGLAPIVEESAACTVCHADEQDLRALHPEGDLRPVADFGESHPPFRVTGGQPVTPDWVKDGGSEGLKFPHDVHMTGAVSAPMPVSLAELEAGPPPGWEMVDVGGEDGARWRSPEGRLFTMQGRADLGCADCHVSEAGGMLMRPVEMERDCAWCHQLKIDTLTVARAVPHAMEEEVVEIIRDYYRARALEGGVTVASAPAYARRPFGSTVLSSDDDAVEEALAWAAAESEAHLARVFDDEGVDPATGETTYDVGTGLCAYCHRAERQEGDEDRPWRIVPARLQRHWMPMARFDHGPHEAMDCVSCHAATTSETAADVLMPEIGLCRDCHIEDGADGSAAANCLACHEYHAPSHGVLSPVHAEAWTALTHPEERAAAEAAR